MESKIPTHTGEKPTLLIKDFMEERLSLPSYNM